MTHRISAFQLPLLLLLFFCLPVQVFAASISDEAQKEIVSQAESFREESTRLPEKEEVKTEILGGETKAPLAEETGPRFILKKITLDGNRVFSDTELEKYFAPFLGREVTFADLNVIAEAISAHYRAAGYTLSKAYILPQKIENGAVTLQIIEGKIRNILVEENKYFSDELYQRPLRLRKDRVFRYQDLENSLYYLNQKADRSATATLVPTEDPGEFDLVLKASEKLPVHVYYTFNNAGTKLTHRERHNMEWDATNLTGHGDILNSTFSLAEEGALGAGAAVYAYPLEETGTTLSGSVSYVRTRLIGSFKEANIQGRSLSFSPGITQTFLRTPAMGLDGFLGLDIKDSKTTAGGSRVHFDRIRDLRTGPRLKFRDAQGRTELAGDIHFGIPGFLGGLDAEDPRASMPDSGGEFIYYTVDAVRIQALPYSSYLVLSANAQWTDDHLTSSEQFRAGGVSSVRGYSESAVSGDFGYKTSAELNLPALFLPWRDATRFVVFVDMAKTFSRDRPAETSVKDRFLLGTGFGIRFDLNKNLSARCDVGFPIGDEITDDESNALVHFSVRGGF